MGIYVNNLWSYRRLIRFGLYNFDSQGRVFIEHAEDQKQEMISGRDFLVELIQYFEKKDEPYAYLYCANLKELLDEYNQKFHA